LHGAADSEKSAKVVRTVDSERESGAWASQSGYDDLGRGGMVDEARWEVSEDRGRSEGRVRVVVATKGET